jgi:hypothetical protein
MWGFLQLLYASGRQEKRDGREETICGGEGSRGDDMWGRRIEGVG